MLAKAYYFTHFGLIFIVSVSAVVNSYLVYKKRDVGIPAALNHFIEKEVVDNPIYHAYSICTGTNTGYGFYGINVATHKYFSVELYDKDKKRIAKTRTFGFKKQNNLARFEVLASRIANYISDNKEFPKDGDKKLLEMRKLYVNKIFKHIGLYEARKTKGCKYYKTTLYTLIPSDIWRDENYNTHKKVAIYKSLEFAH